IDGDYSGEFEVLSFVPPTGGSVGSPSLWSSTAAPSLNYAAEPAQFVVNAGTVSGTIAIDSDYSSEGALISDLNFEISQTALRGLVEFHPGLQLVEKEPYSARRITVNNVAGASRMFGNLNTAN